MISFQLLHTELPFLNKDKIRNWIHLVLAKHEKKAGELSYVFCNDEDLLDINRKFLNHDYYTDIITFQTGEGSDAVSGEMYISVDRIIDNAHMLGCSLEEETHRVIIHGVLHLIGYKDKTDHEAAEMRKWENDSLSILNNLK